MYFLYCSELQCTHMGKEYQDTKIEHFRIEASWTGQQGKEKEYLRDKNIQRTIIFNEQDDLVIKKFDHNKFGGQEYLENNNFL